MTARLRDSAEKGDEARAEVARLEERLAVLKACLAKQVPTGEVKSYYAKAHFGCSALAPRGVWVHREAYYTIQGASGQYMVRRMIAGDEAPTTVASCPTEEAARAALRLMEGK